MVFTRLILNVFFFFSVGYHWCYQSQKEEQPTCKGTDKPFISVTTLVFELSCFVKGLYSNNAKMHPTQHLMLHNHIVCKQKCK